MSYRIDAWLEHGKPRLRIVDSASGAVRLRWACEDAAASERWTHGDACHCPWRSALQRLFKDLFLLACADRLRLVGHAPAASLGGECIACRACLDSLDDAATGHRTQSEASQRRTPTFPHPEHTGGRACRSDWTEKR